MEASPGQPGRRRGALLSVSDFPPAYMKHREFLTTRIVTSKELNNGTSVNKLLEIVEF